MLLAPNGKKSNLTNSQYKLVRTPAFKKWFGDWENNPSEASKVVDENGEPLVVYHGTNAEFNVFDKKKSLTTPPSGRSGLQWEFRNWSCSSPAYQSLSILYRISTVLLLGGHPYQHD